MFLSESCAPRKLKIEFARRYGAKQDIAVILARLFENGDAPFELSEDGKSVLPMILFTNFLQKCAETARNLRNMGCDNEFIVTATGLAPADIAAL
jgi:hypothetical protein